jgi:hypothetical protein
MVTWWPESFWSDNFNLATRRSWSSNVLIIAWFPLVEQELSTLPEHLSSSQAFSEDRVDHFVVFHVIFWRPLFVFLSFGHTFVCLSHLAILLSVSLIWPYFCLSLIWQTNKNREKWERQTKEWQNERDRQKYGQMRETDKSMAKWERQTKVWPNERDRQKYGQMRETDKSMVKWERQTKVWPNERDRQKYGQMRETDKSMAKWKRTKRQATVVKI